MRVLHEQKKQVYVIPCQGCDGLGYVNLQRGLKVIPNTTCLKCNGNKEQVITIGS